MNKLKVKKPNFERESDKKLFLAELLGFCEANTFWVYNKETNSLGHGDDQRDWHNRDEDFIEIEEIDFEPDGSIIIYTLNE